MKRRSSLCRSLWLKSAVFAAIGLVVLPSVGKVHAAEKPLVVDVWPGTAPGGTPGATGKETVREGKRGNHRDRFLTNVIKPTLTVFRPAGRASGTAIIICPGGGYSSVAWDREGEDVANWLTSVGVTGIILKYRVAPAPGKTVHMQPPGEPLQDAQRALSLVRSKATEWNLDPKHIGILGFSAGGHLAASLASNYDRRAYQPIDTVDSVSCRPDFAVLGYPGYLVTDGTDNLAPTIHVRKEYPPTFIVVAADDRISATDSVVMYQALRKVGVSAELHIYATGGHGFGVGSGETASWPGLCAEWMRSGGWLKPAGDR